jgi:hypothetical protein
VSYEDYQAQLAPPWLQTDSGHSWMHAHGATKDSLVALIVAAVEDRFIQLADAEALGIRGADRGLNRYPGESLEIYRTRVLGAFEFWKLAGTIPGLELALAQAGYRATIVEHFRDPDPVRWAEFSLAVSPMNPLPNNAKWGDGTTRWGDGHRWGVDPNAVPTDFLPDLVRQVKPAHARLRTLAYFPRGRFWGGQLTWGEGRATLGPPVGWGLNYGLPDYPDAGTDSGPRWGAEQGTVLYQMEGYHA